jgi:hypothetical protein
MGDTVSLHRAKRLHKPRGLRRQSLLMLRRLRGQLTVVIGICRVDLPLPVMIQTQRVTHCNKKAEAPCQRG